MGVGRREAGRHSSKWHGDVYRETPPPRRGMRGDATFGSARRAANGMAGHRGLQSNATGMRRAANGLDGVVSN